MGVSFRLVCETTLSIFIFIGKKMSKFENIKNFTIYVLFTSLIHCLLINFVPLKSKTYVDWVMAIGTKGNRRTGFKPCQSVALTFTLIHFKNGTDSSAVPLSID